jgi:hypothetical protein
LKGVTSTSVLSWQEAPLFLLGNWTFLVGYWILFFFTLHPLPFTLYPFSIYVKSPLPIVDI